MAKQVLLTAKEAEGLLLKAGFLMVRSKEEWFFHFMPEKHYIQKSKTGFGFISEK